MLRYHVINLRSRVDRLIRIQERLTHPFTVHPAVTRKEAAHARVSRALRPHPWTDPLLHRPINDAEIACFLSHFALWARCAQESDPFVILEDDVEPTPEWSLEAIDRFLGDPSAGANRFDLLYLHYREMREARPATPELLYPTYPYWACAYAITPQGAQKLLRASPLTNGLIPVDEFLATMIGYRHTPPNEGVNRTYGEAPVLRAAALRQPLYRVESRKFLGSDIEGHRAEPVVIVVTVATEYEKAGILLESTLRNEIPEVAVLGLDEEWKSGDPARGEAGWDKLALLKTFLDERTKRGELRSSDVVLFVDGYDTFIHDRLPVVLERFLEFKCHVLFSAESACWPRRNVDRDWPRPGARYRYLNSGAYMGYVGALQKLLRSWDVATDGDDQQFFIDRYLSRDRLASGLDLRLDHECSIFQSLGGVRSGEIIRAPNGELVNTETGSRPCVVHGNGPVKAEFARLAAALGYRQSIVHALAGLRKYSPTCSRDVSECNGRTGLSLAYVANPAMKYEVHGPEILVVDFMAPQACSELIGLAEALGRWSPLDGDKFPAPEIRIREISLSLFRDLEEAWRKNVNPVLEAYWPPLHMRGLRDAFVIKYTTGTQRSLALHNDASLVTGSVKLNDTYEGADLVWPRQNVTNADIPVGRLVLFPGQVTHGHRATALQAGIKYSLTIWTSRFNGDTNY